MTAALTSRRAALWRRLAALARLSGRLVIGVGGFLGMGQHDIMVEMSNPLFFVVDAVGVVVAEPVVPVVVDDVRMGSRAR
jgi:hypothetical protein